MAAPQPNPYLLQSKRLDAQFRFQAETPILDTLNKLVSAIEGRLAPLDVKSTDMDAVINSVLEIALARMDETFTPLINDAETRLSQFGASFNATSTTSLDIGLGNKSVVLPPEQAQGYVYGSYVTLQRADADGFSMTGAVLSYQRDIGQLNINVVLTIGTGTFNNWNILFAAPPDTTFASRRDNPNEVTAAQVGAYTQAEVDALLLAQANSFSAQISNLQGQISSLTVSLGLSDITNRVTALETTVPLNDRNNRWIG